jgi:hypothetical protein
MYRCKASYDFLLLRVTEKYGLPIDVAARSDDRQPGWTVAYKAVSVEEPALVHQRLFRVFHFEKPLILWFEKYYFTKKIYMINY